MVTHSVSQHVIHACAAGGHFSTALGSCQARLELHTLELGFRSRESLDVGISACHVATWATVVQQSVPRRGIHVCAADGHFRTAIGGCHARLVLKTRELGFGLPEQRVPESRPKRMPRRHPGYCGAPQRPQAWHTCVCCCWTLQHGAQQHQRPPRAPYDGIRVS